RSGPRTVLQVFVLSAGHVPARQTPLRPATDDRNPTDFLSSVFSRRRAVMPAPTPAHLQGEAQSPPGSTPVVHRERSRLATSGLVARLPRNGIHLLFVFANGCRWTLCHIPGPD